MALQRSALWAVALTAVALALPASAQADHGTPLLDDGLANYFAAAQHHWGGPLPSCVANGTTVIPVHAVLYTDRDASVAARADQPGCRLSLDRSLWRSMGRVEACTVVVHEWGHLLGYGHVEDPRSLMAEFPAQPPAKCARMRRGTARASARRDRACASSRNKGFRRPKPARMRSARVGCLRRANQPR